MPHGLRPYSKLCLKEGMRTNIMPIAISPIGLLMNLKRLNGSTFCTHTYRA